MTSMTIERHILALKVADACFELGARPRVTMKVSGLNRHELMQLFPGRSGYSLHGRLPNSKDWLHYANVIVQIEVSMFATLLSTMLDAGGSPGEALVSAYRTYKNLCSEQPRISFDRAYGVASHLHGLWEQCKPDLVLRGCNVCNMESISSAWDERPADFGCVFCTLINRYAKDDRLQANFCGPRGSGEPIPTPWMQLLRLFI